MPGNNLDGIPLSLPSKFTIGLNFPHLHNRGMDSFISVEDSHVDVLHEISAQLNSAEGFHEVLRRVVEFSSALVKCDSCLIYVLDGDELVLRASKSPHPDVVDRLKFRVGQGITGWVAAHREPVAFPDKAAHAARSQ